MKQLHTWHWISAAVSLLGTLLFAVTGLTLNHASSIAAEPTIAPSAPASQGSGLGLIGLQERVALYGGTLEAGPRDGDGWQVRATMTIEPGEPA